MLLRFARSLDVLAVRLADRWGDANDRRFGSSLLLRAVEQLIAWPRWLMYYWLDPGPHPIAKLLAFPWALANLLFWVAILGGLAVLLGVVVWVLWNALASIVS